jgi:hypothetical protein
VSTKRFVSFCFSVGFIKTGYGLAVGLVAALVFMRSPALRSGVACFGAGTGFGISITESKALFEAVKPITVKAVKAEVPAPASE